MQKNILTVEKLYVSVEDKMILNGVDLTINAGEVHVLMGPNGAGKSTLANIIMGDPRYKIESGNIIFLGKDITDESPDTRARMGLFLSFQAPEEIPGITLENFLRSAKQAVSEKPVSIFRFKDELYKKMSELGMDKEYASRYLNVGFSGGEKKKSEILQMTVLNPVLAMLDETDSGLDVDAVQTLSGSIKNYKSDTNAIFVITHITRILQNLQPDFVHIMVDGRILKTSDSSIIEQINKLGFASIL